MLKSQKSNFIQLNWFNPYQYHVGNHHSFLIIGTRAITFFNEVITFLSLISVPHVDISLSVTGFRNVRTEAFEDGIIGIWAAFAYSVLQLAVTSAGWKELIIWVVIVLWIWPVTNQRSGSGSRFLRWLYVAGGSGNMLYVIDILHFQKSARQCVDRQYPTSLFLSPQ